MKKKETTTPEQTEPSVSLRPRRAKLIKKQDQTSTKTLAEGEATPHSVNWGDLDLHPDASTTSIDQRI